jgi:hypothetical protein
MLKDDLYIKRTELNVLMDNFCLTSEIVVRKAREFEELANKVYGIKDGAYWMKRANSLEKLLKDVQAFCPVVQKNEIVEILKVEEVLLRG